MTKKKIKSKTKSKKSCGKKPCNKKCSKVVCDREKTIGEPMLVKPLTYVDGEIYPRLIFNDNLWTKFKRLLGLVP